jgi:hypothetical protein
LGQEYKRLFDQLIEDHPDVNAGLMMREPALKCKDKVFVFYYADKGSMCFKLGKEFPIEEYVNTWEFLSPFKNKPPMSAWYLIKEDDAQLWEDLVHIALEKMRG